jgi:hypothetical protein
LEERIETTIVKAERNQGRLERKKEKRSLLHRRLLQERFGGGTQEEEEKSDTGARTLGMITQAG